MAFGFGFNKQKALSAAEKYVQQGKLQNAIAEYAKVIKADPKDLTVTNTIGDLYSRLGQADKATDCFKTVGDAYATQGFTVKAIAMYKKISKLKPSLESVLKLAELYTQQGLFNDARSQYLQVAEEFLKSGELENAVRIFQKILEMDPENTNMRTRLAEVYLRLGKKTEAWQIFSAVAESLRAKGSFGPAEDVIQRMLTLDPGNSYALLMQGRNLLLSGDVEAAIVSLQKVPDLDSNPDGLRDLLSAYLKNGRLSDAGTLASKLLTVHNDLAAISMFADALMQAGQYENALQIYCQHADRLLAEDSDKVLKNLHGVIGHVSDNPASLEKLLDLFQKAGESTHVTEVIELLAHSSFQSGDLPRARDLYQKLAAMEPGNPIHLNHYQQVVSQLGGPAAEKLISAEEAAVIVDELEATSPSLHQHYSDAVALAVRSALTDAELFISYNMPAKALDPLMAALLQAPNDLRLNQRLAALHTRAARFAEAGVCCRTLQSAYSEAGYPEEATRYGELAERYEHRAATHVISGSSSGPAGIAVEPTPEAAWPTASNQPAEEVEFSVVADQADDHTDNQVADTHIRLHEVHSAEQTVHTPQPEVAAAAEIDLSSEWEDAITIDADEFSTQSAGIEIAHAVGDHDVPSTQLAAKKLTPEKTAEIVDEIRFYLEHGMPEQASATFEKLQSLSGDEAIISALRAEIAASSQQAPAVEEVTAVDSISDFTIDEPSAEPTANQIPVAASEEAVAQITPHAESAAADATVVEPSVDPAPSVLQDFVSDLESSLGGSFLPESVSHQAEPAVKHASAGASQLEHSVQPELQPVASTAPSVLGAPQPEIIGEFVADLEATLGDGFLKDAPVPDPAQQPQPILKTAHVPTATPAPVSGMKAASAAAAASSRGASISSHVSAPVPRQSAATLAAPAPQIPSAIPPATNAQGSPLGEEAGVDLAEMFGELKQDLESGAAPTEEDPETHYNLGIAFREMGLLDEAIGELQKTCQAVDRGHPFPQLMQTYTWLAQCFLDKGVPEAAIRWYQKALAASSIDEDTRTALHYELAGAYETAGDRPSALKHFMEVYGRNIDYRDVAERIKPLKT
ncbi:MAG: tetratricopeptide repeat protein [Candidatus Sulfotelmatobacter sp.]